MSNYLSIPLSEQPTQNVTPTTVNYVIHSGIGNGERWPIHRNFGEPYRKTRAEIVALLSWREGWNGYDVAAPNSGAIKQALSWIEDLYEDILTTDRGWIAPHVVADAHGNVVLEWWEGQKKLTIYVSPESAEYVKVWGPDIFSDMEDGEVEGAEDRRALWRWLTE
jgi:hypothetical protein